MNPAQVQKSFVGLLFLLLVCDFAAQLAIVMQVVELQPLVSIWFGPLDDVFYGLCGVQAIYFLLDPSGQTRDGANMGTLATIKKCLALFQESVHNQHRLAHGVYSGGKRAVGALSVALALVTLASLGEPGEVLLSLRMVLQTHLGFLLPVGALLAVGLGFGLGRTPLPGTLAVSMLGMGVLVLSAALEGRLANHLYHLFAALSSLQAWGAAGAWIGFAATWDRSQPALSQQTSA